MDQPPAPTQRVSAISFPERYDLPGKPESSSAATRHAYRQSTFVLGDDLRLFEQGMQLQLRIVRDAAPSSFRTHPYAALMGLWSRTFVALADTCLLATRGAYPSCAALVRSACEYIGAQHQLYVSDMEQFIAWLAGGFTPNEEHRALEFGLGRYFAGEALAADDRLRRVYRPASELGRPSFGATLLQVGPESSNKRLALTFADGSFHVGWAEITLGWLLALCERQLAVSVHADGVFPIQEEVHRAYTEFEREVERALSRSGRCRVEEVDEDGYRRYLAHSFRRSAGGDPKKILL